jgi:LAO/AO transport system kinase
VTLADLRKGGKRSLAEALARIEAAPDDPAIQALLDAAWSAQSGRAIGFTGPPGVGKSSLVSALLTVLRSRGLTVAVLAVDPSSRRSGGALLGDRARIHADPLDQGVFIRSVAARDQLGGLAELAMPVTVLFRALFDLVLIETVGVGQSETEIADLADRVVFCAQPGSGDSLQFMKAGVVEIPDIAVVCKADMGEMARRSVADLKGALALSVRDGAPPPVLLASARDLTGIDDLADAVSAADDDVQPRRLRQAGHWISTSLRMKFGREGLAAIGPLASTSGDTSPFALERAAAARLRARLV